MTMTYTNMEQITSWNAIRLGVLTVMCCSCDTFRLSVWSLSDVVDSGYSQLILGALGQSRHVVVGGGDVVSYWLPIVSAINQSLVNDVVVSWSHWWFPM